jgi:hypothetical protein
MYVLRGRQGLQQAKLGALSAGEPAGMAIQHGRVQAYIHSFMLHL